MLKYLSKVLYILSGSRLQLGLLLSSFVFSSVLEALGVGLIAPYLAIADNPNIAREGVLSRLLNLFNWQSDGQIITGLAVILIILFCLKTVVYFLCKLYILKYSYWQKNQLESRLMRTYLRIPYIFHLNKNSAVLIKNIAIESHQFTTNNLIPLLEIIANIIVMAVLLVLLAYSEISLLVVALVIILPTIVVFARLSRRVKRWGKVMSTSNHNMIAAVNHGLGGLKETKVIGCESHFEDELDVYSKEYAKAAVWADAFTILPRVSIEAILVIFLLAFIVFSQLVSGRTLSELTAVMGMFAVASIRLVPAVSQILCALGQIRFSLFALDMLCMDLKEIEQYESGKRGAKYVGQRHQAYFNEVSAGRPALPAASTLPFNYEVSLEGITYRYPAAEKPAIQDFSLTLRKGESIALVGKSGSGKTTLVDILLGLLQPEHGDIKVDGRSIYDDVRGWQNLLGYIPQSIFLTDSTIEQNIAYGVPPAEIDPVRLRDAIAAAQLEDLVSKMPDGVKTQVGERGIRVSGGQRQRIGIARALYHNREILVLDEATSALDTETEKLVSDAINALAGSRTLIIIAHRFSTIEKCDRIYKLEDGHLKQSGTYREIILTK
ncbi:MAG: ATP-binding cassette domain-containing protein [Cyanobacteria bacterium P01_D01_bin.105]